MLVIATVSPSSADTEHTLDTLAHTCVRVEGAEVSGSRGQLVVTKSRGGPLADAF